MSSEVVELCRRMVGIASVNPQERKEMAAPYGEGRMAAFIADWLEEQGLSARREEVRPGRENVRAVAEGRDTSKTLLLCAHMDTVDVKDMTIEPFEPAIRNGRIYGRGACDDKGPLAALLIAYRDRVQQGGLPCNLALLASCGEEFDMSGSKYGAEQMDAELAGVILAEPTDLRVVVAHKGVARLRLVTRGKSAHSSTPQKGKNAIYAMSRVLGIVEEFVQELTGREGHPRLKQETMAATIIKGGQQINVIPDYCEAHIDWRILPGRSPEECRQELVDYLKQRLEDPIEAELINAYESMETPQDHRLVHQLLDATEKTVGAGEAIVAGYATDASAFSHLHIPTPVWGPGDGQKAHTQDEYIDIDRLEKGVAAYRTFLEGEWGV